MIGSGIGGLPGITEGALTVAREGPAPAVAVLHSLEPHQSGLGPCLDPLRLQGPEPCGGDGVLDRRACHRRRGAAHHVGRRRRDGRRRQPKAAVCRIGIAGFCAARALSTGFQRHARARLAALGRGARRLRHGRGLGHRRARRAGTRQAPRRQNLCRTVGLRHVGRRLSHHRAGRGRRRRVPLDAQRGEAQRPRARSDRLHQRSRHLDAAGRRDRT